MLMVRHAAHRLFHVRGTSGCHPSMLRCSYDLIGAIPRVGGAVCCRPLGWRSLSSDRGDFRHYRRKSEFAGDAAPEQQEWRGRQPMQRLPACFLFERRRRRARAFAAGSSIGTGAVIVRTWTIIGPVVIIGAGSCCSRAEGRKGNPSSAAPISATPARTVPATPASVPAPTVPATPPNLSDRGCLFRGRRNGRQAGTRDGRARLSHIHRQA